MVEGFEDFKKKLIPEFGRRIATSASSVSVNISNIPNPSVSQSLSPPVP